jgi:hypothetical protein
MALAFASFTLLALSGGPTAPKWKYPNTPWPIPRSMDSGNGTVVISPEIKLTCDSNPRLAEFLKTVDF